MNVIKKVPQTVVRSRAAKHSFRRQFCQQVFPLSRPDSNCLCESSEVLFEEISNSRKFRSVYGHEIKINASQQVRMLDSFTQISTFHRRGIR